MVYAPACLQATAYDLLTRLCTALQKSPCAICQLTVGRRNTGIMVYNVLNERPLDL